MPEKHSHFDLMTRMTKRDMGVANVVFVQRRNGESCTAKDVAARFKDCSEDLALSLLHNGAHIGSLVRAEDDGWRVTPDAVEAMRIHYRQWSDTFTAEDERRALESLGPRGE